MKRIDIEIDELYKICKEYSSDSEDFSLDTSPKSKPNNFLNVGSLSSNSFEYQNVTSDIKRQEKNITK